MAAARRLAWGTRAAVALLVAADLAAGLTAITTSNIHSAVTYWMSNPSSAESTYGHISTWDTSQVTSMSYLFCAYDSSFCGGSSYYKSNARYFNDDISAWDTSRVTTMYNMFMGAQDFNQDLSGWNIRAVTGNQEYMFYGAYDFDQYLGWCFEYDVSFDSYAFYDTACGGTGGNQMSRCGVTQQSYCAPPPTPSPKPAATGFMHVNTYSSYTSARDYCRENHIDLASIHSSIENAAVAALCPDECWIGGSDATSEGTWTWSDGTEWNYENWRSGEPSSSYSTYDYLAIRSDGEWYATYYAYSGSKTFVCSTTTPPSLSSSSDKDKDHEDNTGVVVGIFCALALAAAWGFHVYRKKKIKRSRGLKREIKRMNSELNTYKNAAVGMRVAVTAAGPSAPAAGPVAWYWEESPATPRRPDGAFASTAQVDETRGLDHTGAVRATPDRERPPLDPLRCRDDVFAGEELSVRRGRSRSVCGLPCRHEDDDAEECADELFAQAAPLRAAGVQRSRAADQARRYRRRRALLGPRPRCDDAHREEA